MVIVEVNNYHTKRYARLLVCGQLFLVLEEQSKLRQSYPNLTLHCNRRDAVNAELDFYFPDLRLAFELNGICHYEPIYGPEKLLNVRTNDCRKWAACLEKGIELCVLDSSTMIHFKPQKAEAFLSLIQGVVDRVVGDRLQSGINVQSTDPTRGKAEVATTQSPMPPFAVSTMLEEVLQWQREIQQGATKRSQIAKREGITGAAVTQRMYLLLLPPEVRQKILDRDPSYGWVTPTEAIRSAMAFRGGDEKRGRNRWVRRKSNPQLPD